MHAARHECVPHGARDRNEPCNAAAILESSARNERNASRHDERQRSAAEQCCERDRVRACVMGVHEIGIPGAKHGADTTRRGEVPITTHANRGGGDPGGSETADQWRVRRGDHEWFVTLLTLTAGEQIHLSLAAAPLSAGVQVQYAKRL